MPVEPVHPYAPAGPAAHTADRLNALASRARTDESARAELRRACQDVEAHFITVLLREMRRTIPHSGLLPRGPTEETYEELLDDALGKAIASGNGFGIAQALEAQLLPRTRPGQTQAASPGRPGRHPASSAQRTRPGAESP